MKPKERNSPSSPETEYEKWFREEVEAALLEADDPNTEWIPHEVVEAEMQQELAEIEALIAAGYKNAAELDSQSQKSETDGDPEALPG